MLKTIKIKSEDIKKYIITNEFIKVTFEEKTKEIKQDQQKIQDLHEKSGKFGGKI